MGPWRVQSSARLCQAGRRYLEQKPVHHELLLGLVQAQGQSSGPCGIWRSLWSEQKLAGLLFQSEKGLVSFSTMPAQGVSPLCASLKESAAAIKRVHAPAVLGDALVKCLGLEDKAQSQTLMVARRVPELRTPGRLELATSQELPWVQQCCSALCRERMLEPLAPTRIEQWLQQGRVYLWRSGDEQAVSLAIQSREQGRGACIAFVYTPEQSRQRGYARALTGALAYRLLQEDFDYLWLHAEPRLAKSFYSELGFEAVVELCTWRPRRG